LNEVFNALGMPKQKLGPQAWCSSEMWFNQEIAFACWQGLQNGSSLSTFSFSLFCVCAGGI